MATDTQRQILSEIRKAVERHNARRGGAVSRNVSSFQHQVLTQRLPEGIICIASREEELLSLALGIVEVLQSAAIARVLSLQRTKAADYNRAVSRDLYFPFGIKSYVHEIHKKSLRLVQLADGAIPLNESVQDSADDLLNYAAFLVDWLAKRGFSNG